MSFSKKYFDLLNGELAGINLTRINSFDEFHHKQIEDSLFHVEQSQQIQASMNESKLLLDIGFGGGFPILPLAWKYQGIDFIGIEARKKKVDVVSKIATKLGVNNIHLHHIRLENLLIDRDVTCTLKAVGKVYDFLSKFKISSSVQVDVYFYKGPSFMRDEEDQLEMALKYWDLIENKTIEVPGTDQRLLVGFRNKAVPCGTINASSLVKLSELA